MYTNDDYFFDLEKKVNKKISNTHILTNTILIYVYKFIYLLLRIVFAVVIQKIFFNDFVLLIVLFFDYLFSLIVVLSKKI